MKNNYMSNLFVEHPEEVGLARTLHFPGNSASEVLWFRWTHFNFVSRKPDTPTSISLESARVKRRARIFLLIKNGGVCRGGMTNCFRRGSSGNSTLRSG